MAELNPARWEAFTDRERALLCIALATYALVVSAESDTPKPESVLDVAPLVSELNMSMGGEPVDADLIARLQEMTR